MKFRRLAIDTIQWTAVAILLLFFVGWFALCLTVLLPLVLTIFHVQEVKHNEQDAS